MARKPQGFLRRGVRRVKESTEFHAARVAVWLAKKISPEHACALARAFGRLAFAVLGKRRRTALDNILKAGVAADRREAKAIARKSFESMALTIIESFVLPRMPDAAERAVVDISPGTVAALEQLKRGVIMVSGHLGNWEVGAQAVSKYKPLTGIVRPMNNARVQKLMDDAKMRADFETIDKHSGKPMDMVRALKRDRALAILTDQHASGDGAVSIDFFGRKAAAYSTPVVLQRLTGSPILFSYSIREGFMRFRVCFSEPIFYTISKDNKDADILAATQDLATRLEKVIRRYPDQYLWAHRRWKLAEKLEKELSADT